MNDKTFKGKTAKQFALECLKLKPELQNKPVLIQAPNGILFEPRIITRLEHPGDFESGSVMVITY